LQTPPADGSTVNYNLIWNTGSLYSGEGQFMVGTNNLNSDPRFADDLILDFHLALESPAIDAGDSDILDADGSSSDIGTYGRPQAVGW
jgi:hypothetical protein